MSLGVPGRVVAVEGDLATVDFWGVERRVRLDAVDRPVAAGDYVLNHDGFAIERIPAGEIDETLIPYEMLLGALEEEPWGAALPSGAVAQAQRNAIALPPPLGRRALTPGRSTALPAPPPAPARTPG